MVKVSNGKATWEGKVIALTKQRCSLVDRQGRLVHLPVGSLKTFEKTAVAFRSHPITTFRQELRKEFPNYEVAGSMRYLVVGPPRIARKYAKLFDSVYRDVEKFFRVRGFKVKTPDVPLVAVVFSTPQEFYAYCRRDDVPPSNTLRGYYSLVSNRVALYDPDRASVKNSIKATEDFGPHFSSSTATAFVGISQDTADTIIHETTHQVGYNIGVHSRMGGTPIWVIEGLATALEPDAMRRTQGSRGSASRINAERSEWFASEHRPGRQAGNLARLVASDKHFNSDILNSYSEAWAFTYFLLENSVRCKQFVNYLHTVENRDVTKAYTARQRLDDFEAAFGDLSRVELDFLRAMDRM